MMMAIRIMIADMLTKMMAIDGWCIMRTKMMMMRLQMMPRMTMTTNIINSNGWLIHCEIYKNINHDENDTDEN